MSRAELAPQAIRHPPSAADVGEAIRTKLAEQAGKSPAKRATEDEENAVDGGSNYVNSGIDSGYASHASSLSKGQTRTDNTEDQVIQVSWPFQKKRKVIDKPIPLDTIERLANFRILLSKPLKEYISQPNPHGLTILEIEIYWSYGLGRTSVSRRTL